LTPLTINAFDLVKQRREIFFRWRQAFDQGEVDLSTHPALPQDRERYEELDVAIEAEIKANASRRFKQRGEMKVLGDPAPSANLSAFQVKWSVWAIYRSTLRQIYFSQKLPDRGKQ
jgi:hypothetical protein